MVSPLEIRVRRSILPTGILKLEAGFWGKILL